MLKIFLLIIFFISNYAFSADEYFLTLRYDKVNLRQGPSKDHPVKLFYTKKYLPILVQDKFENYRKIRDHENNSGWIHVSQLSKKKAGINIDENLLVYKNPTIFSKPKVILEKGRLCLIKKCKKDWCNITVSKYSGWVKKESLWGKL
jgi:SH3-like domain-containing protein